EQIIFRASMTCLPSTAPCRKLVQPVIANFLPCRTAPCPKPCYCCTKTSFWNGATVRLWKTRSNRAALDPDTARQFAGHPKRWGLKWLAPVQPPLIHRFVTPQTKLFAPFQATMAGDVERQFQPAPDSEFVERVPQIILYYLLRSPDGQGDLAVREPLPH